MRKTRKLREYLCAALLFAAPCISAAGQSETLTNGDIVSLVEAGLSPEVIVRKIVTSDTQFDISTAGIVALKSSKVSDEVIASMIDRQKLMPVVTRADNTPGFSVSRTAPNSFVAPGGPAMSKREMLRTAKTMAITKTSLQPSAQALEKELIKRKEFTDSGLTLTRFRDTADLYVEIGFVPLSLLTHRYAYRLYDRRSGTILAAGETTSWGSLAENIARKIARDLSAIRGS